MSRQVPQSGREEARLEIPEDVAALFAWANLQGARYRDFSASRRESRAQARQSSAQMRLAAEERAQSLARAAAVLADEAAREAVAVARFHGAQAREATGELRSAEREEEEHAAQWALRHAEALSRRAAQQHEVASALAASLRAAEEVARSEARTAAEAHASARRQAQQYLPEEARGQQSLQGREIATEWASLSSALLDPYPNVHTASPSPQRKLRAEWMGNEMRAERFPRRRDPRSLHGLAVPGAIAEESARSHVPHAEAQASTDSRDAIFPSAAMEDTSLPPGRDLPRAPRLGTEGAQSFGRRHTDVLQPGDSAVQGTSGSSETSATGRALAFKNSADEDVPAWISNASVGGRDDSTQGLEAGPRVPLANPNLRDRLPPRWSARRGSFDPSLPVMEPTRTSARTRDGALLVFFSPADGAGKTSLTAALGRALSAAGGSVLLVDLTPEGPLPSSFGQTDRFAGDARTWNAAVGSGDAPLALLHADPLRPSRAGGEVGREVLAELVQLTREFDHILVDAGPAAAPLLQGWTGSGGRLLVPVVPDVDTITTLTGLEQFFIGLKGQGGRAIEPFYLLNQFDSTDALHEEVFAALRRRLGGRVLPFGIRRSAAVAASFAEGMTVLDYAPDSEVAADLRRLAAWVRNLTETSTSRGIRREQQ